VTFGDGRTGARLPTGIGNVLARYRVGIGLSAQVKAGTLTTLLSRPLGAKAVTNPLPAGGAADPETLADARTNAPLTVLTLDRIVSVRDHEDFARSFAGVGAARADLIWDGERQVVHLTAAASDGGPLDPRGETLNNLMLALDAARHAKHPVILSPHEPLSFGLVARVATDPLLIREAVIAAVFEALSTTFGYPARSFGQGVAASQILAAIQNVPGVVAVDLESIGFISDDGLLQEQNPHTQPNLPARLAHRSEDGELVGAELLLISAEHITLNDLVPAT
jgi:predicted phage baseplate assembly protein